MSTSPHPADEPAFDTDDLVAAYAVADRAEPHLRVNFIASIDGAATHEGLSGGLNNAADKQVFDTLRRLADVVIVGAGTVRAEGYAAMRLAEEDGAWRRERGLPEHPVFALVSARLALDPASPVFTDAPARPIVLTGAAAPEPQREALAEVADVIVCEGPGSGPAGLAGQTAQVPGAGVPGGVDAHVMRRELAARGLTQMLCEGGPQLFGTLIGAGAVDEVCLTVSPVLEGGPAGRISSGGPQRTLGMRLAHVLSAGDMLFLRYQRRDA
ncbi:pyrimidine reductase family protein [Occultella glacieicola]|uniref:Pyrimidine reductase family protein n=1 Tax=Occultella glacieicola TaxID=2518684 RepID=A0ABY2E306_9MICO|nr:pyrimidine reductase family protein [Occultella glacieicola]TDE94004.1 pyrimidine reductase family protein [Occultella glacieicola]